jgi:hypothetical protein
MILDGFFALAGAAGSDSTDVIMINRGGLDIEDIIIHIHSMIIFISLFHFCNDGLSGGLEAAGAWCLCRCQW